MILETLDWLVIIGFLVLFVGIGVSYTAKAGKNLESFFLGGRNLPWYIAGISMVATTFAADTPLAVTELVGQGGIANNWLWWSFLAGGMLTTFFFARLWRKAEVLTEVELSELRYSGAPARFLRGFKAVYLGLLMNVIIIAWVNVALMTLLEVFFGIDNTTALYYTGGAMVLVAIYSSLSGLLGVAMTDVVQFVIALTGCIILAILVVNSDDIGGLASMKSQLLATNPEALDFLPSLDSDDGAANLGKTLGLSFGAFVAYAGVQWWASWYPGAEPGGGGYIAQRMMSTRTPKDAVYATLFFQIAHYCLRPWPWIIVGLCAILLYPDLEGSELKYGFVYAMRDYLPAGLKGLLLVAFFAAYMSTISTQLNWGASYLVNDLYRRFVKPGAQAADLVSASRVTTLLLMVVGFVVTLFVESISGAWGFLLQCGAGLGLVLILRWYWWRINAWSEISGMFAPVLATAAIYAYNSTTTADLEFPDAFLWTVLFTTVVWVVVTYATRPTDAATLQHFYLKVQPDGAWGPVARDSVAVPPVQVTHVAGQDPEILDDERVVVADYPSERSRKPNALGYLFLCWVLAIIFTYGVLFFVGKLLFLEWATAGILAIVILLSLGGLTWAVRRTRLFE